MSVVGKGHIVILAGGQGTRFWPMSRQAKPKQFLSIDKGGESFIQLTVRRALPVHAEDGVAPLVVTGALHKTLVAEHLPKASVLAEPVGRNTAPSIGLAAIWYRKQKNDLPMIILPADHVIKNEKGLIDALSAGCEVAAKENVLVTIGIKPTSPNTGYGYIEQGEKVSDKAYRVVRFFEKPSLERATEYLESGDFWWNGGMFIWKPSAILASIERYMPELYAELCAVEAQLGTPNENAALEKMFAKIPGQSIDFGVLEHEKNCVVVPTVELGWDDVGSWDSWAKLFARDSSGNLIKGDVVTIDSKNCVVVSDKKLIATVGLNNVVVIDVGDALLICAEDKVQDVKKVVEELKVKGRKELL